MLGSNELRINEATMMEAVQLWLDSTFKENPPRVESVSEVGDNYSRVFQLKLSSPEKAGT